MRRPTYNSSQKTANKIQYQPTPTTKEGFLAQIRQKRKQLQKLDMRINSYQKQYNKMAQSNQRNIKRLMKMKQIFEGVWKHKNEPEYFLYAAGFMNQHIQQFMLTHDMTFLNINEEVNPDNMSYEQLLQLGQSIGKVSKGISKEVFENLPRVKSKVEETCPVCCTEFEYNQLIVKLHCKHCYHEQCIFQWFKDENVCPVCKKSVLDN